MEPGRWIAEGTFQDEKGHAVRATGTNVVVHGMKEWVLSGTMKVEAPRAPTVENTYRIAPFRDGMPSTRWRSESSVLGTLEGSFVVVSDVILSHFRSPKGVYGGVESLRRLDASHYEARGMMLKLDVVVSSWSVLLSREE